MRYRNEDRIAGAPDGKRVIAGASHMEMIPVNYGF